MISALCLADKCLACRDVEPGGCQHHCHYDQGTRSLEHIVGPNTPITTNEAGGSQSHVPVRFDLIDGKALFEMAAVLHEGAVKYGDNNWRKIPINDHLNHLIMHAYAYLAGDRSDDHLSHIMCRAMFAQAVEIQERTDGRRAMVDHRRLSYLRD